MQNKKSQESRLFKCPIFSPYNWNLVENPYQDTEDRQFNSLKNSYDSEDDYKKIMKPLFYLEYKEPFREFNNKLNEVKKFKGLQTKFFKENAVNVDVTTCDNNRHDSSMFNFKVSMPLYFLSGYQGMNYSKIEKNEKEKRSSGEIKRDDLIYLARVSDKLGIIYYETLAFVKKIYNSDDTLSSSSDEDSSEDDLLDNLSNLRYIKQTTPYEVKCSKKMSQQEINQLYYEIKREGGRWICIHIMSFGAVKKEYDALMLNVSNFMKSVIVSGKINDNKSNILNGKLVNAEALKITRKIAKERHLNQAQSSIIEKVHNKKISLVQGPPGTGKTTMILALIQRELDVSKSQGRKNVKILVCAPSNFACDEIARRLEREKKISSFRYVVDEISSKDLLNQNIEDAEVIISTLCSSGNRCIDHIKNKFSLLIIDEASQATELTTLIPLRYNIPQIIFVGDQNQLPPTVKNKIAEKQGHYGISFFERLQQNSPESVHLLDTQYRMHPRISKLSSKMFYDNKIIDGENVKSNDWVKKWCRCKDQRFGPLRFYNVCGEMEKGDLNQGNKNSICNETEANQVLNFIIQLLKSYPDICFSNKISVISPYSAQVSLIKKKLREYFNENLNEMLSNMEKQNNKVFQFYKEEFNFKDEKRFKNELKKAKILNNISVSTVDSYQGQENDIVILSTVRSNTWKIGFLKDDRRLNVAITRARHSLIIFGDEKTLSKSTSWKKIIKKIKQMKCFVPVVLLKILYIYV